LGTSFQRRLVEEFGAERVIVDPAAQRRYLEDRSFALYSALVAEAFANPQADAIFRPASTGELKRAVEIAVEHRRPITVRGAGTGNYGQSLPLSGGMIIDIRALNRVIAVNDATITVEAGAVLADAERAAREKGREMRLLPSTYHVATASGFVAGGSGGIGSASWGRLWNGNVLAVDMLTATVPSHPVRLEGDAVNLALHTYGVVGVITRVTFPLAPARDWVEAAVEFGSFEAATRFAWELCADAEITLRLCSLQQAPIPSWFEPVKAMFPPDASAVLLMHESGSTGRVRRLAESAGGAYVPWPTKPSISQFPFSHTILWIKRRHPDYSWLQYRFDPGAFFEQLRAMEERFGSLILHHVEFMRVNGTVCPDGISALASSDPKEVDQVIRFLESIGVEVLNPHSYVVEEGGMVEEIERVLELKARTDPFGLLNPGKIGRRFYDERLAQLG